MNTLISSQRFIDNTIVLEKIENEDFEVQVSPCFELGSKMVSVVLDGHHSMEAAKRCGKEIEITELDSSEHDAICLLKSNDISAFLEAVYVDSYYYFVDSGENVW